MVSIAEDLKATATSLNAIHMFTSFADMRILNYLSFERESKIGTKFSYYDYVKTYDYGKCYMIDAILPYLERSKEDILKVIKIMRDEIFKQNGGCFVYYNDMGSLFRDEFIEKNYSLHVDSELVITGGTYAKIFYTGQLDILQYIEDRLNG